MTETLAVSFFIRYNLFHSAQPLNKLTKVKGHISLMPRFFKITKVSGEVESGWTVS